MLSGTQLVPALRRHPQGLGSGWHGLDKLKHYLHQGSLVHLLGLRLQGIWHSSLSLRTHGLIHLRGLAASQSSLHRGVRVDVVGHSTQRLTNEKIVEEEMYS
jgi:hypothetical protein